jgi:hypothetical protein
MVQDPKSPEEKQHDLNRLQEEYAHKNIFDKSQYQSSMIIPDYFQSKPKVYAYDPRLTNSVFMQYIIDQIQETSDPLSINVPFSWYDWTDLTILDGFIRLHPEDKPTCDYVCSRILSQVKTSNFEKAIANILDEGAFGSEEENESKVGKNEQQVMGGTTIEKETATSDGSSQFQKRFLGELKLNPGSLKCSDYCIDDKAGDQPGFRIFALNSGAKASMKTLHTRSYLYSEAQAPNSLVLITSKGNFQVNVKPIDSEDKQVNNMVNTGLMSDFISKRSMSFDTADITDDFYSIVPQTKSESSRPYSIKLDHERFIFDAPKYLEENTPTTLGQHAFHESLRWSLSARDEELRKYLKESAIVAEPTINGAHFDARFFNYGLYSPDARQQILSRLLRSWFQLCENSGLISWIAHGVLLSHSYNGLSFPWDDDIDVQMPFRDFSRLAELYNSSLIIEDPKYGYGRYYLDITNSITHRTKGNGLNRIDGRFIDVQSGLFIDITALGVSATVIPDRYAHMYTAVDRDAEIGHRDPNMIIGDYYTHLRPQEEQRISEIDTEFSQRMKTLHQLRRNGEKGLTQGKSPEQMFDINYRLKIYNCRNNHIYQLNELSPLRLTYHDKISIYVPHQLEAVLLAEYNIQPTLSVDYLEYTFLPQLRLWIYTELLDNTIVNPEKATNKNLLTEKDIIDLLDHEIILDKFQRTWDATLLHEKEKSILQSDIENKDELLEELLKDRSWNPLWRDAFIQNMAPSVKTDQDIEEERENLKFQIKNEYSKKVDYSLDGRTLSHDYNEIAGSLKDIIQEYQRTRIDSEMEAIGQNSTATYYVE